MPVEKFTDAQLFIGSVNASGIHNQVSVEHAAEMLDATVFGTGTRTQAPGLKTWAITGSGFWETAATPNQLADPNFFNAIGAARSILSVAPKNADLGAAYFGEAVQPRYQFFGALGELTPFTFDHEPGAHVWTRGVVGLQPSSRSAGGNGSISQLGTVAATQKLVAGLHVVAFNGTTMTMNIQSDDNGGFASPTTRITFTAATGLTSEWKELQGPITPDDRFRAQWTFTGTSFTALVVFGIWTP